MPLQRYAAQLLLRMANDDLSGSVYEARIITIRAESARDALQKAKQYGESATWRDDIEPTRVAVCTFEGVMELLNLEDVTESEDEVWFDILGEEQVHGLVLDECELSAIKNNE